MIAFGMYRQHLNDFLRCKFSLADKLENIIADTGNIILIASSTKSP
jgi:hypothetical protein